MGYLLFRQRLGVVPLQRLFLVLGLCMIGWHGGNLVVTLRSLLGANRVAWDLALKLANTVAVVSITFCYSLLLHVHIHLWAKSLSRELKRTERLRIYLSYIPCLFLFLVVPKVWTGPYQPMIAKLSMFVLPFAIWVVYSLGVVAVTELLVAKRAPSVSERRILRTLAYSFLGIAVLILSSLGFGLGKGTIAGQYLQTFANLGSLLPSALLVYYIYRYRFLELIIKESLIGATFAAVVLAVYVYGIRRFGDWASSQYGLRAGVVEAILILGLTLLAAPLRGWLEKRFRALFERETALYRDVVGRIASPAGRYSDLGALLESIESQAASALSLRRVKILLHEPGEGKGNQTSVGIASGPTFPKQSASAGNGNGLVKGSSDAHELSYILHREDREIGVMLVDASATALTADVRAVLDVLAGQIAIAVEDWRLANENIRLERELAEGERLAALGQIAATVAHEVKNPLSAIKSIAQVMSEDHALKRRHARDLSLIVGETDRLNKSVTQLLSFASRQPPAATPSRAAELVRSVVALFNADAAERNIRLRSVINCDADLDGVQTAAVRDALANLLLNALQVTPQGGEIQIATQEAKGEIAFVVSDNGPGVDLAIQQKIWEPFFTTRQRGTGLGLSIVRKRMEEAGGSARLVASDVGATFELRVAQVGNLRGL